jgi:hypothetical protein
MTDDLTRPERFTEIAQAIEARRANGCAVCVHRVAVWNRSICKVHSLTFPRCMSGSTGVSFRRDFQRKAA